MILKCLQRVELNVLQEHNDRVWLFDGLQDVSYEHGILVARTIGDVCSSILNGRIRPTNRHILFCRDCDGKYPSREGEYHKLGNIGVVCDRKECGFELWPELPDTLITSIKNQQPEDEYYQYLGILTNHKEGEMPALLNCYVITTKRNEKEQRFLLVEGTAGYIMNDNAQTIEILK